MTPLNPASQVFWYDWAVMVAWFGAMMAIEFIHNKRHHHHDTRAALNLTIQMIAGGLLFGLYIWYKHGTLGAVEYYAGFLTEKSLSVDNLFVFLMIFRAYKLKEEQEHVVLFWGILGAILLRALFVGLGAPIVHNFHWVLWFFGAFLAYKGYKALFGEEKEEDPMDSPIAKFFSKRMPVSMNLKRSEETKLIVWRSGWFMATALLFILLNIEAMDVVFAVDSVPAIFSITDNPFIVYAATMFAILGLRAIFFLIQPYLGNLPYIGKAMGLILSFIGVKMVLPAIFTGPKVLGEGIIWLVSWVGVHAEIPAWLDWPARYLPHSVTNVLHVFMNEEFEISSTWSLAVLAGILAWAITMSLITRDRSALTVAEG